MNYFHNGHNLKKIIYLFLHKMIFKINYILRYYLQREYFISRCLFPETTNDGRSGVDEKKLAKFDITCDKAVSVKFGFKDRVKQYSWGKTLGKRVCQ